MEALWSALAPLVGAGAAAAALESSSAVSEAIAGVAVARIAPAALHPLREIVGDGALLLAYAATGAGAADDGGEQQEPVAVVRMATAAPHGVVAGLPALSGTATTTAVASEGAATYLRAPTGLLPLATARCVSESACPPCTCRKRGFRTNDATLSSYTPGPCWRRTAPRRRAWRRRSCRALP